jgi:hypothetical protein
MKMIQNDKKIKRNYTRFRLVNEKATLDLQAFTRFLYLLQLISKKSLVSVRLTTKITSVLGFKFFLLNPSSRTMVLGSTQPLTEMSTRNVPRG